MVAVLATLASLAGAAESIWSIVERLEASSQAARSETERLLKFATDIGTVSKATGLGLDQVQRARYALSRGAGLTAEEQNQALIQLTGFLNRARGGDETAISLLRRYGFDTTSKTLGNLSTEAALDKIVGGLATQPDATHRTVDATQVFGAGPAVKLSAEAVTLAANLKQFTDEFDKQGNKLNESEIAEAIRATKLLATSDFAENLKRAQTYLADETTNESLDIVEGKSPAVMAEQRAQLFATISEARKELGTLALLAKTGQNVTVPLMEANEKIAPLMARLGEINKAFDEYFHELVEKQRLELEQVNTNSKRFPGDIGGKDAGGMLRGKAPERRASGGPVSAFAPYLVGERGPEIFVPRGPGIIVPNRALGAGQWPWSASSPEVAAAKDAIGELQTLLDELDFDWQGTFERMTGVLLDFAETGKFEWRDLAKIAIDSIEQMLRAWLELQAQKMAGGEGETNPWSVVMNAAGSVLGGLFGGGGAGGGTLPAGGVHGPTVGAIPKAAGGPVSALSPYLVGEEGPELFVPRVAGAIVPNHALGEMTRGGEGGRPVIVNLNVSPGVPEAVRREVAALIPQITQAAKLGVAADMDRNGTLRRRMN